jgi:hypothetical protein
MMVWECMSTYYVLFWIVAVPASGPKDLFVEHVLFWIVAVPASGPKDLFVEHVTMGTAQSTGLIWVGLVMLFSQFYGCSG